MYNVFFFSFQNPLALPACTYPGLFEELERNNGLLEEILKCLEDYLESKRVVFPRFYFLSNEELLEILAQVCYFTFRNQVKLIIKRERMVDNSFYVFILGKGKGWSGAYLLSLHLTNKFLKTNSLQ